MITYQSIGDGLGLGVATTAPLSDPLQYQSIVDAEWNIIYDKLDKCVKSGAKIVLSRLAIGDLATQYFADRDILCARRRVFACMFLYFFDSWSYFSVSNKNKLFLLVNFCCLSLWQHYITYMHEEMQRNYILYVKIQTTKKRSAWNITGPWVPILNSEQPNVRNVSLFYEPIALHVFHFVVY
ncbi:hypothetical protein ACJX0J_009154, partial [Zea mays]